MDVRISSVRAKEILEMFIDWDQEFVEENSEYKRGYIGGTKDFLSTLELSVKDLESLCK